MSRSDCVTTIGLQKIASYLAAAPLVTYIAIGDDDTPAEVSDLSLDSETYRQVLDSIAAVDVTTQCVVEITASDIGTGEQTVEEVGCLDSDVGRNLICRHALDTPVKVTGAQKLKIVYNLVQGTLD